LLTRRDLQNRDPKGLYKQARQGKIPKFTTVQRNIRHLNYQRSCQGVGAAGCVR
jgi:Adenylylsulphate kinase